MLSEHETMCCAHCGPPQETLVRIDCDGESMVVILNAGWCFRFMIVGGPRLALEVYCPTCSIQSIAPTLNNIQFTEPISPQCNCERSHPKEEHDDTCPANYETYVAKCPHCNVVWPVHSKENPRFTEHPKELYRQNSNFKYSLCEGSEQKAPEKIYKKKDYPYTLGFSVSKVHNPTDIPQNKSCTTVKIVYFLTIFHGIKLWSPI